MGEDASGDAGELAACGLFEFSRHDRVARAQGSLTRMVGACRERQPMRAVLAD